MIVRKALGHAVFDPSKMGKVDLLRGEHLFAGLNTFEPGQDHAPHTHCDRDKMYVVLEGRGEVAIGDERAVVKTGDVALAPANVLHSMRNPGPDRLVVMVVMAPPPRRKSV